LPEDKLTGDLGNVIEATSIGLRALRVKPVSSRDIGLDAVSKNSDPVDFDFDSIAVFEIQGSLAAVADTAWCSSCNHVARRQRGKG